MIDTLKRCTKCGAEKSVEEFGKRTKAKDGKNEWCKVCVGKSSTNYRKHNREKVLLKDREYKQKMRLEFPKIAKEQRKKWYDSHREEMQSRRKQLRVTDRFGCALKESAIRAKKYGYMPCDATKEELAAAFTGRCMVCGVPEAESFTRLHADHEHSTGKFRGFLCVKCNHMIGLANDNKHVLEAAYEYLENCEYKETEEMKNGSFTIC